MSENRRVLAVNEWDSNNQVGYWVNGSSIYGMQSIYKVAIKLNLKKHFINVDIAR
jgi:hypothetical protein